MLIKRDLPKTFKGRIEMMIESSERLITEKKEFLSPEALSFHTAANNTYKHVLEMYNEFNINESGE